MALTLDTGEDMARQEWHRRVTGHRGQGWATGSGGGEPTPTLTHTSIYKYSGWVGRGRGRPAGYWLIKKLQGAREEAAHAHHARRHDPPIKLS